MRIATRCGVLAFLAIGLSLAASAPAWQTGQFSINDVSADGWRGVRNAAARSPGSGASADPLNMTVMIELSAAGRSYFANITGLLIDRSVSYQELFPWLATMPPTVPFRVKGKTLYYLDGQRHQRKAQLLRVE